MRWFAFIVFFATAVVAAGAQTPPEPHGRGVWTTVPDSVPESDTLSLAGALARVKLRSPALRGLAYRVDGASALIDQAGARPNPDLVFEAENVGGSYSGFDQAELSLLLGQELELGGKRSKRIDLATRVRDETSRDALTHALDLFLETRSRYADVVHAERRILLSASAEGVIAELAKSAQDRVRAGATLVADAALASAALARVRTAVADAEAERDRARIALSALWGEPQGFDDPVARDYALLPDSIPADSAASWAARSPVVRALQLAAATQRAEAALERSLRVPNVTLGAGARRIEADDASTFLLGVGLPIPLWDRRGGAIRAAEARLRAAESETERARVLVAGALAARANALARLRARLAQADATLIPALTTALENMRTAYGIGRASYADLLEVQRTLIEIQNDANDTRRAIVAETIEIERIAGRTIEELMSHE